MTDIHDLAARMIRAVRKGTGCRLDREHVAIMNEEGLIEDLMILQARTLKYCQTDQKDSSSAEISGSTKSPEEAPTTFTGTIDPNEGSSERQQAQVILTPQSEQSPTTN